MASSYRSYYSTDASAPTLTGQAGSLASLLNNLLVGTAGIAYGAKASAGWTLAFTGTAGQQYDFLMPASAVSRRYLQIDDSAGGTGGAKEALSFGFEVMTAWGTGTGQFPTTVQLAAGIVCRKSATADATARAWKAYADDRSLLLFIASGDTAGVYTGFYFGEIFSLLSGDLYGCSIIGRPTPNSATVNTAGTEPLAFVNLNIDNAAQAGHYTNRSSTGTGGSLAMGKYGDLSFKPVANGSILGKGGVPYPNPPDSGLYLAPVRMVDPTTAPTFIYRGRVRGLWDWLHAIVSVADGDTLSPATGDYSGRTFDIIKSNGAGGIFLVETSATLESN